MQEKDDAVQKVLNRKFQVTKDGNKRQQYLTDKERKRVVAEYVESGNLRATAKKFGITAKAVQYIVDNSPEYAALYRKMREREADELLAYMSTKFSDIKKFIDNYMIELIKPETMERMARTNMVGATVVLGTLLDKVAMVNKFAIEKGDNGDSLLRIELVTKKREEEDSEENDSLEEE